MSYSYLIKLLVVGSGGFLGAICRYGLSGWVQRFSGGLFPWGTLAVNTLGCLAIGVLMALVEQRQLLSPNARLFWMIGLLGSFTTFSTFGYETFALLREKSMGLAILNIGGNVVCGLIGVWIGWVAVKALVA